MDTSTQPVAPRGALSRVTRWSFVHRGSVTAVWALLLVGAIALATAIGSRDSTSLSLPGTGSQRATSLLKERFPRVAGDRDEIVFHARAGRLDGAGRRTRIEALLGRLRRLPHVVSVESPFAGPGAVSRDGRTGFATLTFDRSYESLNKADVDAVVHASRSFRTPDLQVELGGGAISQTQTSGALGTATAVGLAAAVVVLLLSFGSLLGMGLPIVTALAGLGVATGAMAVASHVMDIASFAPQLAFMIGLGVGVDYALLIVTRYRQAYVANDGDVAGASELAMRTSGRAVLFAGTTVVVALLGLFALGVSVLYGVAVAAALAVLAVLAASLTLLPALIGFAGHRLARSRRGRREDAGRFWPAWITAIQRRPRLAAAGAAALMLALAAPAVGLRLGTGDAGNDPGSSTTRRAYDLLSTAFGPGINGPLLVTAQLPRPGATGSLRPLVGALEQSAGVASVSSPRLDRAGDVAVLSVVPRSSPQSSETASLVHHLRHDVIPPAARAGGLQVFVGGFTATQVDFAEVLAGKLPLFVGLVVLVSALLLLIVFRSLVIPLQAAAMNLLSIAAALGVVQAVFERGWLSSLLGVHQGPIEPFIPVVVFAIVFGLSMDYEVFLVSRIHEEWQRGGDASAAVREGLVRTGRVITAAAAVMVVVFASFVLGDLRIIKLFGLALASAVLLDAIVVRSLLLPAVLEIAGRATWSLPAWLHRRLPRLLVDPPGVTPVGREVS